MNQTLELACVALDALAAHILSSWGDDRTLNEIHGWHHPAITRKDIAAIPAMLAAKIRAAKIETLDTQIENAVADAPRRLQQLHGTTVTHIFNGNAQNALPAVYATLDWIKFLLDPVLSWQAPPDSKAMPTAMARRLRGINAEIDALIPAKDRLTEQIQQIQDATEAAESLPTDLQSLRDARRTVLDLSGECAGLRVKIGEHLENSKIAAEDIVGKQAQADRLIAQCDEAYRANTTQGLAGAFDTRAKSLGLSMWFWVALLLISLAVGSMIGSQRIQMLSSTLGVSDPHWGVIWMQVALSALSIGAPLWFAWVATKQIGHRFKLAEDYGYKASVAKAYEGYRKEAGRIDEAFEARLFASALTRLEEAPLRLMGGVEHGSPWHELIQSDAFKSALATFPELRDKVAQLARDGIENLGKIGNRGGDASTGKSADPGTSN